MSALASHTLPGVACPASQAIPRVSVWKMTALPAMRKAATAKGATPQSIVRAGQMALVEAKGGSGHLTAWADARAIYDANFADKSPNQISKQAANPSACLPAAPIAATTPSVAFSSQGATTDGGFSINAQDSGHTAVSTPFGGQGGLRHSPPTSSL